MFGRSDDAEIRVLSAAEPVTGPVEPFAVSTEYLAEAERAAAENSKSAVSTAEEQVRTTFPKIGDRLSTKTVKDKPVPAILEEAEEWGADLIVNGLTRIRVLAAHVSRIRFEFDRPSCSVFGIDRSPKAARKESCMKLIDKIIWELSYEQRDPTERMARFS